MIRMSDYKDEKGDYDWKAYDAARLAAGEKCITCGGCIVLPRYHGRQQCSECSEIRSQDELRHSKLVRCPKCMDTLDGFQAVSRAEEGEQKVTCWNCDHEFEVSIRIEYTFTSPKEISRESEDD